MSGLISRRRLICSLGVALLSAGITAPAAALGRGPILGCAWQPALRRHVLVSLRVGTAPKILTELPGRGHGVIIHPARPLAVVMARRPGNWALVVDLDAERAIHRLMAPDGRHFYGHGAFDQHGDLYLTENDYLANRGMVARYKLPEFRRSGDMPSGGIGPHEILAGQGGKSLIVANGGILTRPETGRAKLNLDSMQPNLARLTPGGNIEPDILYRPGAGLEQSSIRHIDSSLDGTIVAGIQFQGDRRRPVPLIITAAPSGTIGMLPLPDRAIVAARQYIGAVAISSDGRYAAASAPRAGMIYFWDIAAGGPAIGVSVPDGCGVAWSGEADIFHVSSGRGQMLRIHGKTGQIVQQQQTVGLMWDNHLVAT